MTGLANPARANHWKTDQPWRSGRNEFEGGFRNFASPNYGGAAPYYPGPFQPPGYSPGSAYNYSPGFRGGPSRFPANTPFTPPPPPPPPGFPVGQGAFNAGGNPQGPIVPVPHSAAPPAGTTTHGDASSTTTTTAGPSASMAGVSILQRTSSMAPSLEGLIQGMRALTPTPRRGVPAAGLSAQKHTAAPATHRPLDDGIPHSPEIVHTKRFIAKSQTLKDAAATSRVYKAPDHGILNAKGRESKDGAKKSGIKDKDREGIKDASKSKTISARTSKARTSIPAELRTKNIISVETVGEMMRQQREREAAVKRAMDKVGNNRNTLVDLQSNSGKRE